MSMDYRLYQEIAQLGKKGDKCTFLMRGPDGRMAVCKEVDAQIIPIYHKLQKAKVPGVAEIYGFFIHRDSEAVMMEYIPAITLEEKLLQAVTLSPKETKAIALQICQVLFCLEQLGIVHRDLTPANILLAPDGRVVLTDFGISRMVKRGKDRDTTILGTVGYTAPEQFGFAQTDTRADIYSLGVLVNQMLTGKLPQETLYRGDVRISGMIEGCIQISPKERWGIQQIEEALAGKVIHQKPLVKRLLYYIPGFRTQNPVHMTLAAVEYGYMTFTLLLILITPASAGWLLAVRIAGYLVNTIGIGFFVGSFKPVAYRLQMDRGIQKVFLVVLYFIIGFWILYWGVEWMSVL